MKKTIIIAAIAIIAAGAQVSAQEKNSNWKGHKPDMDDKIKSEKIAFLTTELNITSEEAADFWAVYNEADLKRSQAMKGVKKANFALKKASKDNQDVAKALDDYCAAIAARNEADKEAVEIFRKKFGDEKAARLITAEDKFIQFQLFKLNGGHGQGMQHKQGNGQGRPQMKDGEAQERPQMKQGEGQHRPQMGQGARRPVSHIDD